MSRTYILIEETSPSSCSLTAKNVRDIQHVQRLLLQALFPMTKEGSEDVDTPLEKLALLRNFLSSLGAKDTLTAQRILIMGLFQLADEMEEKRIVLPEPMTKIIL